jgi:hypothetical protein
VFCCTSDRFAGPSANLVPDINWISCREGLGIGDLSLKQ